MIPTLTAFPAILALASVPPAADTVRLPVSALLDSAALHAGLVRVAVAAPASEAARTFQVRFGRDGTPASVAPATPDSMPAAYRDAVVPLLRASLRPSAAKGEAQDARLVLTSGPEPTIVRAPAEPYRIDAVEELPRLRNLSGVQRDLVAAVERVLRVVPALHGRTLTRRVAMVVGTDGVPVSARLVESTGVAELDREMIFVANRMRFRPARLNGSPVPVRVQLPINFVLVPRARTPGASAWDGPALPRPGGGVQHP